MFQAPIRLLTALAFAAALHAADDAAAAQYRAAFQGSDLTAKKEALQALTASSASDDVVLPLLVQAVGDRQAQDAAISALRARTKLAPSSHRGTGGYPGYPTGDAPEAWQAWITARTTARQQDEKLKEALKLAEDAKLAAEKKPGKDGKPAAPGDPADPATTGTDADPAAPVDGADSNAQQKPAKIDRPDLGRLDRVVFKSGGFLLCYIISKRTDADGALISVRVMHPDEGGEETLTAELVARIEEDIQ